MGLSTKLETFARVLAETDNQSEAYRAMIPNSKATNESVWTRAGRVAKQVEVQSRVAELKAIAKKIAEERFEIREWRVLQEISRIAFNDPRRVFDNDNNMLPIQEWPDDVAACISSIKVIETNLDDETSSQLKEIKFWSKDKQIELAAKKLGMLTDKLSVEFVNPADELEKLKIAALESEK